MAERITGFVQGIAGGSLEVDCALVSRGDAVDGIRVQFGIKEKRRVYKGMLPLAHVCRIGPAGIAKTTNIDMKSRQGSAEELTKLVVQSMLNCSNSMLGNDYREVKVSDRTYHHGDAERTQFIVSWANILDKNGAPIEVALEDDLPAVLA